MLRVVGAGVVSLGVEGGRVVTKVFMFTLLGPEGLRGAGFEARPGPAFQAFTCPSTKVLRAVLSVAFNGPWVALLRQEPKQVPRKW